MKRARTLAAAVVSAVAAAAPIGAAPSAGAATQVTVAGFSSWQISELYTPWSDRMFDAENPVNVELSFRGSGVSRSKLIAGDADFAISGVGFTDDEVAQLAAKNMAVVAVPVHVATSALILSGPGSNGLQTFRLSDDLVRSDYKTYDRSISLDTDAAAAMLVGTESYQDRLYISTLVDDLTLQSMQLAYDEQLGLYRDLVSPDTAKRFADIPAVPPVPVMRADPSAQNYFLQRYLEIAAPGLWKQRLDVFKNSGGTFGTVDETWKFGGTGLRDGAGNIVNALGNPSRNPFGTSEVLGGLVTAGPPWMADRVRKLYNLPGSIIPVYTIKIANKRGELVAPTSASATAAVAAGGMEPLYAAKNDVPGAYPLTWVESAYLPVKAGMDAAKIEAVADFLRTVVLVGQDDAVTAGDGRLSATLVTEALKAIDKWVDLACPKAGATSVSSTTASAFLAPTVDIAKLGPHRQCPSAAGSPSTTTTSTSTSTSTTSTTTTTTTSTSTTTTTVATSTTSLASTTTTATTAPVTTPTTAFSAITTAPATLPQITVPAPILPAPTVTVPAPPETTTALPTEETTTVPAEVTEPPASTEAETTEPPPPIEDPRVDAPGAVIGDPAIVASALPFPIRSDGRSGFDRFATMILGALGSLVLMRRLGRGMA